MNTPLIAAGIMKIKEIDQIKDKIYIQMYYIPNNIKEQLIKIQLRQDNHRFISSNKKPTI
jgi:hypothetical protein